MKKSIFMALAGVMMVSSAAHAISVTGEAGEHYTNLGVGFGTESTGLAVSGNWLHSDNDGDAAENRRQLPPVRRLLLLSGFALQRH